MQPHDASLECSEAFLSEIVRGSRDLGPAAADAFPDNPDLLFRAAFVLEPGPDGGPARKPFLTRALALLTERSGGRLAKDYHLEALVRDALGQPEQALDAYRAALVRDPLRAEWRYEFAQLLYRQGRSADAERELRVVVREQPGNAEARDLLRAVLEGPDGG
jgi:tetratricopeptide (TPR) repeat protein